MPAFIRWNEGTQIWEKAVDPTVTPPTWVHLAVANPTQPLDIANKAYVDSAASGFNGGTITGKLTANGGINSLAFSYAGIEIGNPLAAIDPRLSFHWHGVVASQIGMDSAGAIRTYDNPGTGFAAFKAGDITASGIINGGSYIMNTGVIYPGRNDVAGQQGNWYLASNANYGLYTNTGMYFQGGIYPQGGMDPYYLLRSTNPTDFTPSISVGVQIVTNFSSTYIRYNGWLFVNWMWDCNYFGDTYVQFAIPGGFTAQRYAQSGAVIALVNSGTINGGARIEVSPGSTSIIIYSNQGVAFTGSGRIGGQIMIWVG